MAAIGTLPVLFATGIHASRPAASAVGGGGLYACSTHGLIYQTDGASWTTWATLGAAASGSITASGYTQTTARLLGRTTASTGAIEEITVGSGLTLSAGSLSASGSAGAMAQISDTTLGSDTASFDLTSIPGTYKDLRIVLQVRSDRAGGATGDAVRMRFNNDSSAIYDIQYSQTYGTASSPGESLGATSFPVVFEATAASAPANTAAQAIIDIVGYAGTTWQKAYNCRAATAQGTGTQGQRDFTSGGNYRSTTAITRVTISPVNGSNFKTGSRCTLYGIG